MKKYKFLFLLLFSFFIFLPKDTFAITPTTNGYSCIYNKEGGSSCYSLKTFNLNQQFVGPNSTFDLYPFISTTSYIVIDYYNQSFCNGDSGGTWTNWFWFNEPVANDFEIAVRANTVGNFTCATSTTDDKKGIRLDCIIPKSFNNTTLSYTIKPINDYGFNPTYIAFNFGAGTYSVGTEVCSLSTGDIISSDQTNTQNIISNDNKNTDKIIESNEQIKEEQEKTNEELGELNDNLTSEEAPDLDALEDSAGWLPPGPVDSILNLPLSLFQNLTDNLSKACQPVIVELPYVNENITLPCISTLYEQIGVQTFLNWVGIVVGALILYNYFLHLYQWVDDTLTFRENNWQDWGGV